MFKRKAVKNTPYIQMSIFDLLKEYIISKLPQEKRKLSNNAINQQPKISEEEITHIAIVLDGVVEDVMRAQNRLAALVLSNPEFIEFDPKKDKPQIGETQYKNEKFVYKKEELMSENEISKTLNDMGAFDNNENT